ncbi:MAG: replication protein [Lachnospiraceae bacterium]|nr:replication protein [Lachnospiraceae bacterium]
MSEKPQRLRDFATIVYPESAPENWLQILKDLHVPCFVSPLHDRDVSENGKPKKPHYHVMLLFESLKTPAQAIEIFDQIGGVGLEYVKTRRGYCRYLCHLDDPNKAQYNKDDVIQLGGMDYYECISIVSDKYAVLNMVICFIKDNHIENILDLYQYAIDRNLMDWIRIIQDKSFTIDLFCKANRDRRKCIASDASNFFKKKS